MSKMGRPKAENPRLIKVTVRLTEEENMLFLEYADKHNLSKSDAIKKGLELLYSQDK